MNLGFSRLSDSAALAQYANKYLYSMPEPSMKPKEYEQAIELVFDGQGSHQGELYVLVDWELTPEEAVEQGLETDLLDGVLVPNIPRRRILSFPSVRLESTRCRPLQPGAGRSSHRCLRAHMFWAQRAE